ncbi:MAG: DUF3226 domain-containing protein [Anaerolineae bacterium]
MAPSRLLLVEGPDDRHTFSALLRYHGFPVNPPRPIDPDKLTIEETGGYERLRSRVRIELKPQDTDLPLQRLGMVVDADDDLPARWQSVRDVLSASGYRDIPMEPRPDGTVITQLSRPTVGVWIMPDNTLPGILEHFVEFMVPGDDVLWLRAKQCLIQLPEAERRFRVRDTMKAHVHTWLAWQAEPGKPISQAITSRYLDADAPHARQFIEWVRRTFDYDAFAQEGGTRV